MKWAVFYLDASGEGFSEQYDTWTKAHETLHGFIDMINPKTKLTFHAEANHARPEHEFHATDGIFQFAIETI